VIVESLSRPMNGAGTNRPPTTSSVPRFIR
jgi:hypothetical protein